MLMFPPSAHVSVWFCIYITFNAVEIYDSCDTAEKTSLHNMRTLCERNEALQVLSLFELFLGQNDMEDVQVTQVGPFFPSDMT